MWGNDRKLFILTKSKHQIHFASLKKRIHKSNVKKKKTQDKSNFQHHVYFYCCIIAHETKDLTTNRQLLFSLFHNKHKLRFGDDFNPSFITIKFGHSFNQPFQLQWKSWFYVWQLLFRIQKSNSLFSTQAIHIFNNFNRHFQLEFELKNKKPELCKLYGRQKQWDNKKTRTHMQYKMWL